MNPVRDGVRRVLRPLGEGAVVVVACSGGADSLALAAAAVREGHRLGQRVVGATVDHGLQPGSADQAAQVVRQLAGLGVDETLTATVQVAGDSGLGPEAAAREARYAVLGEVADRVGATVVLLGHTLDDQAETVLLGLARGSGGRSLAGMRRAFEAFARPLLDCRRSDTLAVCRAEGLEPWDDPHNTDPGYARVRVRERVLPVLETELGPGVTEALGRTADLLRDDTALLDALADEVMVRVASDEGVEHGLDVDLLAPQPPALRRRVIRAAAVSAGCPPAELFHRHVLAVDELLTDWRGQQWIDLPGPVRARRAEGRLRFEPT